VSIFANPASDAADRVSDYVTALLKLLGERDPLKTLEATLGELPRAVAGLTHEEDSIQEAPGKWSVREVVQHLADSELVGGFRFRMVLSHDEPSIPGYDQDLWAERLHYVESDISTAMGDFTTIRRSNLRLLKRATAVDMQRVLHHAERGDESLSRMIQLYAAHDLVHLQQIARIRSAINRA
jgi:hypothetical protein